MAYNNIGKSISRNEVKRLIVRLKDDEGLSYTNIAKYLKENYGLDKSRQTVCAIYHRYKSREEEETVSILDVTTLYAYGYTMNEIIEAFNNEITMYRVSTIIKENMDLVEEKRKAIYTLVNTVMPYISNYNGYSLVDDMQSLFEYKGFYIKPKVLCVVINIVCGRIINDYKDNVKKALESYYEKKVDVDKYLKL